MKRIGVVLLLLVLSAGLLGCSSQGEVKRDPYSNPDAARARGADATKELDRNVEKKK